MRRVGAPNAEMEGDDGRPATRLKVEERSREEMGTEGAQSRPKRCQDGSLAKDEPPRKQPRLLRPAIPPPLPTDRGAYPGLKDKMSPPNRPPSKDGHYEYELGENITPRFKILSKIGEGTFGRVFECWDRVHSKYVAIKVIKNIEKYRQAALLEIDVLAMLKVVKVNHVVELLGWFDYRGYVCIVFEMLGPTLYDLLKKNGYLPFRLEIVKELGRQLLKAVSMMHELKMIHTDLKPENILFEEAWRKVKYGTRTFREPQNNRIKLIDFGSTVFEHGHHPKVVSTRHYRAPEIILGLDWSYPCDMWSIGCVLFELIAGVALFQTHEDNEHLAMMDVALGPCPQEMVERARKNGCERLCNGHPFFTESAPQTDRSKKAISKMLPLREMIETAVNDPDTATIVNDCLSKLLQYDPKERPSARNLLEHQFFKTPAAVV